MKQNPHTMQLKSVLLKKSKTQGRQQTLPAFYTFHTFAEERFPTGAEKFVNGKKKNEIAQKTQDHHRPDGQFKNVR